MWGWTLASYEIWRLAYRSGIGALAIGFAGGLRRSEIVGLDCGPSQTEDGSGWVEIFPEGALLTIRGKTGWREVEIGRGSRPDTCPVALLEKAHRCASRVSVLMKTSPITRSAPPATMGTVIAELEALVEWCRQLTPATASA